MMDERLGGSRIEAQSPTARCESGRIGLTPGNIYLFGSVFRGESGREGYVDFLVDFVTGASLDQVGPVRDLEGSSAYA